MIKRIIIEGADQQGKSTLCKMLSEKLNWDVIHFGKPSKFFNFLDDYIIPENHISDRNFVSEIVYSKINGVKSRAQFNLLNNIFKTNDTLFILMDREEDFKFDFSRHEDYSVDSIYEAINSYRRVYENITIEKVKLNPNNESYEEQISNLIERINGNS